MISPKNNILVKIESRVKEKVENTDLDLTLMTYDPLKDATDNGICVAVPKRLEHITISARSGGLPKPSNFDPKTQIYLDEIIPQVCVGDKVYFNYKVAGFSENLVEELDDGFIMKCRYDQIYASVRKDYRTIYGYNDDGDRIPMDRAEYTTINPIGSYVLIEPLMETEDEIMHPIPGKPKEEWLYTKPAVGVKHLTGTVRHLGTGFISDHGFEELRLDDVVFLRKNTDKEILIEGTKYYPVRFKDILFKYEKAS